MNKYTVIPFRHNIKNRMKQIGTNVPQICQLTGIRSQTLYRYLNEKSEMKSDTLEIILITLDDMEREYEKNE